MLLAEDRPLLREHEIPVAALPAQAENMLHDARLLIVGFFDQEGVVLERLRSAFVVVIGESS